LPSPYDRNLADESGREGREAVFQSLLVCTCLPSLARSSRREWEPFFSSATFHLLTHFVGTGFLHSELARIEGGREGRRKGRREGRGEGGETEYVAAVAA
jgi:hypothetical protein